VSNLPPGFSYSDVEWPEHREDCPSLMDDDAECNCAERDESDAESYAESQADRLADMWMDEEDRRRG
jgi:hypothetical protein